MRSFRSAEIGAQFFRSGAIESVESQILEQSPNEGKVIPAPALQKALISGLDKCLAAISDLQVGVPVFAMVTLLEVKDYRIGVWYHSDYHAMPIEREDLLLPDVLIEDFSEKAEDKLLPVFDVLWQASGLERCFFHDNQGKPKRV